MVKLKNKARGCNVIYDNAHLDGTADKAAGKVRMCKAVRVAARVIYLDRIRIALMCGYTTLYSHDHTDNRRDVVVSLDLPPCIDEALAIIVEIIGAKK